MTSLLAGLAVGLSLIVAIGAQNVFVLRQGIRREHVLAVVLVCAVSDAVLIGAGVMGIGYALQAVPWLIDAARWLGAAFLIGYGLLAARRAGKPAGEGLVATADDESPTRTGAGGGVATVVVVARPALAPTVLTCLALTWLNPHVYLDTVFLLGSIASTYEDQRWLFAAGAVAGSVAWFFGLGFGARYLGQWLRSPKSWRILDAIIAAVMIGLGISLAIPAFA
ncbi:MAG TPA: LysE/ArgO family amino acid transporter [Microbacterium sp.]|uniref:LysE/ArgO family amino acid transporter n=1 Tax=Microbacterium sp. TaxID=51671 RepID=UPI002CC49964|nr:LysE/ArgO family amino acid transporter [Microbacterium sp.]HWI31868.1 LysE/ArgO family amino acid transporter [Microbacterium sp.]